ncbi:hypothetical protein D9M72_253680 [compost metagenome]
MQAVFLDVLQQGTAHAVDDAFGYPGGAAGVEDVQRLVEGHRGEVGFAAGLVEVVPQGDTGAGGEVGWACLGTGVGDHHQLFQPGHALEDFAELGGQVQVLAGIAVTGGGNQHPGLDLAKAVDHTLGAEVRRAG